MDPQAVADLLNALLCLAPFCLGVLGFIGVGVLMVWIIRRQWRPLDENTLAAQRRQLQADLNKRVAGLRSWSPEALTDLSTDWNAHWNRFARTLNVWGTIPSVSAPKGPPWVAFKLKVRGARQPEGLLAARTTAQSFEYRLSQQGVSILVDGAPLGSVLPDGTLLGPDGAPIGSAPRPGGMPVMFRLGTLSHLRDNRPRSYPVTLGGRLIAHLSHPPAQLVNVIHLKKPQYPPAVTLVETPTQEEATWLLALVILQVAGYNTLETAWTN